jgi:hypothetical protein
MSTESILRTAMDRASDAGERLSDDEITQVANQVAVMLSTLKTSDLPPPFKHELNNIVLASYDLVATLLAPNYLIDEIVQDISVLQGSLRAVLSHAAKSRPRISGYGLYNPNTGAILPQHYNSKAEAEGYLDGIRRMGIELPVEIVPVETVVAAVPRATNALLHSPSDPTLNDATMQRADANTQAVIQELDQAFKETKPTDTVEGGGGI